MPKGKAPGEPPTKVERLRVAVAAEDWPEALRLALKLTSLGEDEEVLSRAREALQRPDFLRQVKKDPDAALKAAVAVLKRRWGAKGPR